MLNADIDVRTEIARNMTRTIDLDIDIGADAVDYKYVPLCSTLFTRPVHLPPPAPAPSPIKSLSPESRRRCANWKDSSKRSWTSWAISRNGRRDPPTRIGCPLLLPRPRAQRTSTARHASRSPLTPKARLAYALKTIWPHVGPPVLFLRGRDMG